MAITRLVTGLASTRTEAEAAVRRIMELGYAREDLSLVMSDAAHHEHLQLESGTRAAAGAGFGGAIGGALCAALAAVLAVGSTVLLPAFGLVVAGPIAAALAGAGAGGAAGGLLGAFVGMGIPEYRARIYEVGLFGGGIVIGVDARSPDDARKIEQILADLGSTRVQMADGGRRFDSFI